RPMTPAPSRHSTPRPPTSTLFPYTTLFRSRRDRRAGDGADAVPVGRRERSRPLLAVPAAGPHRAAFPGSRGEARRAARGEAFAARSQALTAARGEAGTGRGGEARAGSRGQALATTKAEAVARGVAHSRARAGDPRAGAHGNGLRPHRRHAPADRPGSGPEPEAGARAPAAPTRLARGGAEADRRGPPDVRRCLPHRAVRG